MPAYKFPSQEHAVPVWASSGASAAELLTFPACTFHVTELPNPKYKAILPPLVRARFMSDRAKVAIFWDYENCSPPSSGSGLGYDIANNVGRIAHLFGTVVSFRAYLDVSAQSPKSVFLRSELQSSGVSMIDCPHNGRKDVVDKMILVDMLAFAVDHPIPATIILITGDRDYAYAVSTLKLRKYQVVLIVPSSPHTSLSLEGQASLVIDWGVAVLRTRSEPANSKQAVRQPYPGVDANVVTKLLKELQDSSLDDQDATTHPCSNAFQSTQRLRRMTRELPEPSRQCKNTESFDSMQELTFNPASPGNSTSTGSDSTLGGLPISRTPSCSRRASISTGSTWARSTTTVTAQSPPTPERNIPAKNPPLPSARRPRSNASDITNVVGAAKRSPSVAPSLDTLELPLDDSCPPSSIVVRPSLEVNQLTPVSEKPTALPSQKLSCLASPFVVSKAPVVLGTIPSSCTQQSLSTAGPTSPIMVETKTLPEVVAGVRETPQPKSICVPKETKRFNGTHVEDKDANSGRSIPHSQRSKEGPQNATDTSKSNCLVHVAPHTAYSPSSGNVGVHPTDGPSSKLVAPPMASLRGVDDVNSQVAVFPHASNTPGRSVPSPEPVLSSSTHPSISSPFASTQSHDDSRRRDTWTKFRPLIHLLLAAQERGIARSPRSTIAPDLVQSDRHVYQRAGVSRFRDYTALAEQAGIIELGGVAGEAWIALHPNWFDANGVTTTSILPSSVLSPMSNPLNAIQDPTFPDLKTPLVEKTTIPQSSDFTSPEINSPVNSNMLSASSAGKQGTSQPSIPAQFQPLINFLIRMRDAGFRQTLIYLAGQALRQDVYDRAGASGFDEYVYQASEAQLVQLGEIDGHEGWIRLHPELRV